MKVLHLVSKKWLISFIMITCLISMSTTSALAGTTLDSTESTAFNSYADTGSTSENSTTDYTTYSGANDSFIFNRSGSATFFDGATITVNNVASLSTLKLTLSGNPDVEYRVTFTNSTTPKYIKANGSSCSVFTVVGGTIGIQISLYNGKNGWITARVTN